MRWLFFVLLLFNLIFYVAQQSQRGFVDIVHGAAPVSEGNIVLLSELSDGKPANRDSVGSVSVVSPSVPVRLAADEGGGCWLYGPFSGLAEAKKIKPAGSLLSIREEESEVSADYWVHLGPFASFELADARFRELRSKRVDSFVVRNGELKNAVSLGVFKQRDRAELQVVRLRKAGYPVEVRRVAKAAQRYWLALLDVEQKTAEFRRNYALLGELRQAKKGLEKKSCNLIASYKELD